MSNSGHFTFNGVSIPFINKHNYKYDKRVSYLTSEEYFNKIKNIPKLIGDLVEEIPSGVLNTLYVNSYIEKIYLTTNFPGNIEVCFGVDLPPNKIRSIKLDVLIED